MLKYDFQLDLSDNSSTGIILKKIKQGSRVLEFGCATGRMTKYMHDALNCHVSIIELDGDAYEIASAYADDGICGNIMDMEWCKKYHDVRFDFIIFADVLEHLSDPDTVISEAAKLLSPDGIIVFSIPNITHGDIILKQFSDRFDYTDVGLLDNTHIHFWGLENIRPFAEQNGLFVYSIEGTFEKMGRTEQKLPQSEVPFVLSKILRERKCSSVYQFVVTLGKNENKKETDSELYDKSATCRLYIDNGSDFNENDVQHIKASCVSWGEYHIEICKEFTGIKRLRLDPIEGQSCIIKNLEILQGNNSVQPVYGSHIALEDGVLLVGSDPMVIAELAPETSEVKITVDYIINSSKEFLESIIRNYQKSAANADSALKAERDSLSDTVSALRGENNNIKNENSTLQNQINFLQTEKTYLSAQCAAFTSDKDRLFNENSKLIDENKTLILENNRLTVEKRELSSENGKLTHENNILSDKCSTLADENNKTVDENRRLLEKLSNFEKMFDELTKTLDQERARAESLKKLADVKDGKLLEYEQHYANSGEFNQSYAQLAQKVKEQEELINCYKRRKCVRIADKLRLK